MIAIRQLYRYPVKGLSPEALEKIALSVGEGFPGDRRFALALAHASFDPAAPRHLPKTNFLMLQRDESLARLRTRFDDGASRLNVEHEGGILDANLSTETGRTEVEAFFAAYMGFAPDQKPRLSEAACHMFSDLPDKVVSLINLTSVAALGAELGVPIDPLRFRANVYFDGAPAWEELDWVGKNLKIGGVRLEVVKRTQRCAATNVNLDTAKRDLNIPKDLMDRYGHMDMGVYARVLSAGTLSVDEEILLTG
jgi:uncharacterized protein YcbX